MTGSFQTEDEEVRSRFFSCFWLRQSVNVFALYLTEQQTITTDCLAMASMASSCGLKKRLNLSFDEILCESVNVGVPILLGLRLLFLLGAITSTLF
jgi:hypothetical protein